MVAKDLLFLYKVYHTYITPLRVCAATFHYVAGSARNSRPTFYAVLSSL